MGRYEKQLKTSLAVYIIRGEKAIECLENGDIDKAIDFLNWRTAAFHNFRAAENIESKIGFNAKEDKQLNEMAKEIEKLNAILEKQIESHHAKLKVQFKQVRAVKGKITKFRSGGLNLNAIVSRV